MWPPRSHSASSQVSAVLFLRSDRKVRVDTNLCIDDIMRVSRLQVKGQQHHLSQNIGPAIAGPAGVMVNLVSLYPHTKFPCGCCASEHRTPTNDSPVNPVRD